MVSNYFGFLIAHMADLLSVFMVLVILSGRREARATLGWLLLVVFLPYVGAALYVFIGRKRPEYHTHPMHPALPTTSNIDTPPIMKLVSRITGVAPVRCCELELMHSAARKYERLFADIENAQKRIVLCYYVYRRDRTGRKLLELLSRKAEQGVKVYLLYDGWGAFELGLFGWLKPFIHRGVRIEPFAPVSNPLRMSRINFRNHRKIVVIDGQIAYTGSINIGDEYLGHSSRHGPWRDLHVRLTGEAATILEGVFAEDWRIATGENLNPPVDRTCDGHMPVHVLPTGPDISADMLYPLLFTRINRAKESIDILTPYLVPNQGLVAALSASARQGVRVRLIVPKRSNHPMVAAAGRSHYAELLEGGVEIFQTPGAMLHAKSVMVDRKWVMIGSANFDNRSFFLNFEINLALSDREFIADASQRFESWAALAEPVTQQTLAARPAPLKLFDSICRTLSPVL